MNCYFNIIMVVLAALTLLTTFLLGWQIYQSLSVERRIRNSVKKSTSVITDDFVRITDALYLLIESNDLYRRRLYLKAEDVCFSALRELSLCKNQSFSRHTSDKAFESLLQLYKRGKDEESYCVLEGKRDQYLLIISSFDRTDKSEEVSRILQEAKEVSLDHDKEFVYMGWG